MDWNEALWNTMVNDPAPRGSVERAAFNLAEQNAEDTAVEKGLASFSAEWFGIFASSYQFSLDTMTDEMQENWSF